MHFTEPIGLFAMLALPLVLVLHLFRRKLQNRRVAGLFLFAPDRLHAAAGRRRSRLLRTASLWLELAAAALLALWLGGLSFGATRVPVHAVFVLDDSASLTARVGGQSSAERVRQRVTELVGELEAGALATVILTGVRPEILHGPRELAALAPRALADWSPWQPHHDPGPALELGAELAIDASGGLGPFWLLSDRLDAEVPPGCVLIALGEAAANASIASARRRVEADRQVLLVDLLSYGGMPQSSEVVVSAIGASEEVELVRRKVELEPGRVTHLSLRLPSTDAPLRVSLTADAFELDNHAILVPESRKVVAVHDRLPEEISAALELDRILGLLPALRRVEDPAVANLVLNTVAGDLGPGRHELVLASAESSDAWVGPFLLERRHALLDGLTLDGVVWSAGRREVPGVPLVLAGTQVLLAELRVGDSSRLWLNLDPLRSNLPTSPDWPILLQNVIEQVRSTVQGAELVNLSVGTAIQWRHNGSVEALADLRLIDPDGRRRPGRGLRLVSWEARRPGLHRLTSGETELARYSVNFVDAAESDLRATSSGEREAVAAPPRARASGDAVVDSGRDEGQWLALLLLLVVLGDWWVLAKGGQV